ncbi:monofunctional biosynthetic peptidoglycan transglycosylase [Paracoccaceae bacterium]|jgi:monofunctional biosynthetic peptidoglycan transglycosylase
MSEKPSEIVARPASAERKRTPASKAEAKAAPKVGAKVEPKALPSRFRKALRWTGRGLGAVAGLYGFLILLFAVVPPPINLYQIGEAWRLGGIEKDWVSWDEIAPVMGRAAVAAEDANFCNHWGFDIAAIREEIAEGGSKGRSTLSQQMVKNVFLWHGRSYVRKAMEAVLTPAVELVWTKRRVLLVYLNTAEFAEGVFGVQAAAQHHFGVDAVDLTPKQAARLAAVLPNPKEYNAGEPGPFVRKRAGQILSGAETIKADGRSACFDSE